ncbi:MAG: hypothetical protein KY428_09005 [Bacteroidetes bacterium]|nr:hypothetical protein [Bacteroidota bacterium]
MINPEFIDTDTDLREIGGGGGGRGTTSPVNRITNPATPPSSRPPEDATPTIPTDEVLGLDAFILITSPSVRREYIKNSMKDIPSEEVKVHNTSEELTIDVKFKGTAGVSFSPSVFKLAPKETQLVKVGFDHSDVNTLPEGTNRVSCVVELSSTTVIRKPEAPPTPPKKPTKIKYGTYLEEKWKLNSKALPSGTIFTKTPTSTRVVGSISTSENSPVAVRWTGKQKFETGRYAFKMRVDDGVRLYLDGKLIGDFWQHSNAKTRTVHVDIQAGDHDIKVEYCNTRRKGVLNVSWKKLSATITPTPSPTPSPVAPVTYDPVYKEETEDGSGVFSRMRQFFQ